MKISKHPMLLFNFDVLLICSLTSEFQNILCYCLTKQQISRLYFIKISKHPMLLFNFTGDDDLWIYIEFQNILCYCLTFNVTKNYKSYLKFQNILCYCLTGCPTVFPCRTLISKHPMLLFNNWWGRMNKW